MTSFLRTVLRTKTGKILTDEYLERLADGAETVTYHVSVCWCGKSHPRAELTAINAALAEAFRAGQIKKEI